MKEKEIISRIGLYIDLHGANQDKTKLIVEDLKYNCPNRILIMTRYTDLKRISEESIRSINEFFVVTDNPRNTFKVSNIHENFIDVYEKFFNVDAENSGINFILLNTCKKPAKDISINIIEQLESAGISLWKK